jgi:hypothetical protein
MTHLKRGLKPIVHLCVCVCGVGGGDVDDSVCYLLVGWVQI